MIVEVHNQRFKIQWYLQTIIWHLM